MFDKKHQVYLGYIFYLLSAFTFLTFISSFYYLFEDNKTRTRWDNIITAEFIFFKSIDMCMLSFYDFFDDSEFFNTTLFITLEKVVWMIIETILDNVELKEKVFTIIQIVVSVIPSIFFILYYLLFCCIICRICRKKPKKDSENE